MVSRDDWSDLKQFREMPEIDFDRLHRYRMSRLKAEMQKHDVDLCVMVSPISLRYAINYRNYAAFMSHIPSTYLFLPREGEYLLYNAFDPAMSAKNQRKGQPIAYMYGGDVLDHCAALLAADVVEYLCEIGSANRRVAVEYVNPSITQALEKRGLEVIDGVIISERARLIKNEDELDCIRWAVAVAEHGATKVKQALKPGVSELQLWALLNYANLANNGDWHDGRMLASGPRINPWLQEASERKLEAGDLMGFDTDMIGPMGYFADLSRTLYCGPGRPTIRQKQLYRYAVSEIEHNLDLLKPGLSFSDIQQRAYPVPEEFRQNAYPCIIHGVGMCDEYPHIHPQYRGPLPYDDVFQAGMVVCVESYMGAVGEPDGVKLEQQVVITDDGYELLTGFAYEETLISG
ncbi:MAG: aminopeptidase P family protein [Gammaproteobacteria bacterium]|nr:aminopeptidase P family protein [Gammaproteobacteria bacterium]